MKRLLLLTILIGLLFTSPNSFAQSSKPKRATIKYGNGVKYVGEIRKVSPKGFIIRKMKFKHGTGIMYFANGDQLNGEWCYDQCKRGTYKFAYGDIFEGEISESSIQNGKMIFSSGLGTMIFASEGDITLGYKIWHYPANCSFTGTIKDKKPYTIVMPPPNITGQLHMGHALDETLQDILIRWRRMQGYTALWLPGTDHASIATEAKIVEAMRKEGITKEDIGREEFLKRAWEWKKVYGGRITSQLKKLGSSCDWERERFTMDEGCSKAVKEVFVRLYNDGKIYRGNRMVNWCPHCCTSISDAEVEYKEQ
ncbi:class I tRNA ligase family protein, partial [Alistipes sp.]|uniref:class I tRNA ligase family protein n=1 Tax=Alistipes sp. TaxID=1872444 RepID=UPI0023F0FBC2